MPDGGEQTLCVKKKNPLVEVQPHSSAAASKQHLNSREQTRWRSKPRSGPSTNTRRDPLASTAEWPDVRVSARLTRMPRTYLYTWTHTHSCLQAASVTRRMTNRPVIPSWSSLLFVWLFGSHSVITHFLCLLASSLLSTFLT